MTGAPHYGAGTQQAPVLAQPWVVHCIPLPQVSRVCQRSGEGSHPSTYVVEQYSTYFPWHLQVSHVHSSQQVGSHPARARQSTSTDLAR